MIANHQSTIFLNAKSYLPVNRSFIIQFEADVDMNKGQFKGRIEHVVTGKSTRINSLAQLLAFIEGNI